MTMSLVQTVTVGSGGAADITFTSIPQDADDLVILLSTRIDNTDVPLNIQFNSDTGANYSWRRLLGNGSATSSSSGASQTSGVAGFVTPSGYTASTFGNTSVYIPNYKSSVAKSFSVDSVVENNATLGYQLLYANSWTGTAAISTIKLFPNATMNFVQHSSASLYKIKKA